MDRAIRDALDKPEFYDLNSNWTVATEYLSPGDSLSFPMRSSSLHCSQFIGKTLITTQRESGHVPDDSCDCKHYQELLGSPELRSTTMYLEAETQS